MCTRFILLTTINIIFFKNKYLIFQIKWIHVTVVPKIHGPKNMINSFSNYFYFITFANLRYL